MQQDYLDFANVTKFLTAVRQDYQNNVGAPAPFQFPNDWQAGSKENLQFSLWKNVESPENREAVFEPGSSTSTSSTSLASKPLPREAWRYIPLDKSTFNTGALDAAKGAFPTVATIANSDPKGAIRSLSTICDLLAGLGNEYRQLNRNWRTVSNEQVFREIKRIAATDPFALPHPPNGPAIPKDVQSFLDNVKRAIAAVEAKISRDVPGYQGGFRIAEGAQWDAYLELAKEARVANPPGPAGGTVDPRTYVEATHIESDFLVRFGEQRTKNVLSTAEKTKIRKEP